MVGKVKKVIAHIKKIRIAYRNQNKKKRSSPQKKTVLACLAICTKRELIYTVNLQSLFFVQKSMFLPGWVDEWMDEWMGGGVGGNFEADLIRRVELEPG